MAACRRGPCCSATDPTTDRCAPTPVDAAGWPCWRLRYHVADAAASRRWPRRPPPGAPGARRPAGLPATAAPPCRRRAAPAPGVARRGTAGPPGVGRCRRRRPRAAAGQPAALCRGHQGRQADRRPDHRLAEGRQALARTARPRTSASPSSCRPSSTTGIGEAFVLGGLMAYPVNGAGGPQVVEFVRVHNQVRLQARNLDVIAKPGTPEARAVAVSYSPSLLGSSAGGQPAAPAAQDRADRGQRPVPQRPARAWACNCSAPSARATASTPRNSGDHRGARLAAVAGDPDAEPLLRRPASRVPQPGTPPGMPVPTVPRTLPDPRSLFVGHHYSLAPLAGASRCAARRADARVGLMTQPCSTSATTWRASPRVAHGRALAAGEEGPGGRAVRAGQADHLLARPQRAAEVPRGGHARRILEWNKAFEKIGFKDAIVVKQQPDDADFDTLDLGYASVRWMMTAVPSFGAIGPSMSIRAAGEILDADIGFESLSSRSLRSAARADAGAGAAVLRRGAGPGGRAPCRPRAVQLRRHGRRAAGLRAGRARGARRDRPRQPAGPAVRARLRQGHDHARGRPRARACATTSARRASTPKRSWPTRSSRAPTAPPAR